MMSYCHSILNILTLSRFSCWGVVKHSFIHSLSFTSALALGANEIPTDDSPSRRLEIVTSKRPELTDRHIRERFV